MKKTKSRFQRSALYFAGGSFIASAVCVVFLILNVNTSGWQNPITASFLASSFFFVFVAVVLIIIGITDIPSFKVGDDVD